MSGAIQRPPAPPLFPLSRAPQACLGNQLRDLYRTDQRRIEAGSTPLYLLSQYAYGNQSSVSSTSAIFRLDLPLPYSGASILRMEVAADSLRFITNTAPGQIAGKQHCRILMLHTLAWLPAGNRVAGPVSPQACCRENVWIFKQR